MAHAQKYLKKEPNRVMNWKCNEENVFLILELQINFTKICYKLTMTMASNNELSNWSESDGFDTVLFTIKSESI